MIQSLTLDRTLRRLQKLAEEGVLFRQNFCVNPTCSPSRAALLTGCYPHENGMIGLAHRGFALKRVEPPPWLRGKSLAPLVQKKIESIHEALFDLVFDPMECRHERRPRWPDAWRERAVMQQFAL